MALPDHIKEFLFFILSGTWITGPYEKLFKNNLNYNYLSVFDFIWVVPDIIGVKSSLFQAFINKQANQ